MRFEIKGSVEIERESGKFASREQVIEMLQEEMQAALENADWESLGADGESVYNVVEAEVNVT